jgi:hypothetical protein
MTIQIIDNGSSPAIIRQLWIADTAEELQKKSEEMISRYHPCGYGTKVSTPALCETVPGVKRYAGKFFCNFSRYTSCD